MSKEIKHGIYRVTFKDGKQFVFWNNYKLWWTHAREFTYYSYGDRENGWHYKDVADAVTKVEYSNQQFYDNGGLKWCDFSSYQEVIDDVVEKYKFVSIKASDIVFGDSPTDMATLLKKLKEY